MPKVFIDGQAGTTGLRIKSRLQQRDDIELLEIDNEKRKDSAEIKKLLNASDITFLCLPDEAAKEAAALLDKDNKHTKIIDASTAHRTAPGWAYGFPELSPEFRKGIEENQLIANPGCYASGFIALVKPLIDNNIVSPDCNFYCHAMSGYSGAGKKGIALYENDEIPLELCSPREYALTQEHKHLKEMKKIWLIYRIM